MQTGQVVETDPDEDILIGWEMASKLMQEKKLSQAAISYIISLFDNLSEAHAHMSMVAVNLSLLSKITDPVTFKTILHASIHPMVQLSIPKRFLDPIKEPKVDWSPQSMISKIKRDILPMSDKAVLEREPVNGPTQLLCAVMWLKLSHTIVPLWWPGSSLKIIKVNSYVRHNFI